MQSFLINGGAPRPPMSPEDQKRAMVAMALNQPKDIGSGIDALGQALMYRRNRDGSFPVAPGATPGANPLSGLFAFGARKGGLY